MLPRFNLPMARAGALLAGILCLAAAPKESPGDRADSDFWMNIAQPGRKKFQDALRRGREAFESSVRSRGPIRTRGLEDALSLFQQAIRNSPSAAEGFYWLGKTAYALDRTREAIDAFNMVRRLQPEFGDEFGVSFKLGIAYSKLGRFEEAVQEYNRADRVLAGDTSRVNDRSVMHANAAESLMAMGRLDEAVQRYQEALALQQANVLAWWGLAVALDRDEQVSKAREAAARALGWDANMARLTEETVFFVPEGDIHYYFALGYLAKGDGAASRREWESFLAKLPKSAWAFRARQHLLELGAAPPPRGKRLAPMPRPGSTEVDSLGYDQNAARYRIQGYLYRLRQCYQKELKQRPTLAGQLRLGITIGKDGRAQDVRIVSSSLKRSSLHACIVATVKTISFNRPSSGGSAKVSFPMEFKPVQ